MKKLFSFFLDTCQTDVTVTTQKMTDTAIIEHGGPFQEEHEQYYDKKGKWSVVDFLVILKCKNSTQEKQVGNVLEKVLEEDPDLNNRSLDNTTPLHKACEQLNVHLAKLLLKGGPLHQAVPKIPKLKEIDGKNCNIPLLIDLCKLPNYVQSEDVGKRLELFKMLYKADASVVNDKDEEKDQYILHQLFSLQKDASSNDFVLKILEIISKNVQRDMLNSENQTAVQVAMIRCSGNFEEDLEIEFKLLSVCQHQLFIKDKLGRTALHYIFVKGEDLQESYYVDPIDLCRKLCSYDGRLLYEEDNFGRTPLHYAAYRGATMCSNFFIQRTSSSIIDRKDIHGNTPLALAAHGEQDSCATLLVQAGCDTEIEVTNPAKEEEADVSWKWKPNKNTDYKPKSKKLFEVVLEKEMNSMIFMLMELPPEKSVSEIDAIQMGINCKKYSFVLRLFSISDKINSITDRLHSNHDRNLLHVAALVNDEKDQEWQMFVVQKLMKEKVLLSTKDDFKCTPLFYCLLQQKCRLAEYMIKMLPTTLNYKIMDGFGRTLLAALLWNYIGVSRENEDLLNQLLDKTDLNKLYDLPVVVENFNHITSDRRKYWTPSKDLFITPLIFAIVKDDFQLAQLLLQKGANVNIPDGGKRTPLMYAIMKNNVAMVKLLLNHSYDPDAVKQKKNETSVKLFGLKPLDKNDDDDDDDCEGDDDDDYEGDDDEEVDYNQGDDDERDDDKDANNDGDEGMAIDKDDEKTTDKYETVEKTSCADLTVTDDLGNNIIHYFVQGLQSSKASFANEELLYVLVHAGGNDFNFEGKNNNDETPLDLALTNHAVKAAQIIQKMQDIPEKEMEIPDYDEMYPLEEINFPNCDCDPTEFVEQAKKIVKQDEDDENDEDDDEEMVVDVIQPEICEYCEISDGKLVMDKDQDLLYTTLLTKVDVSSSNLAIYNFYEMQLLYQEGKDLYILFTRWGRIGDRGMNQTTPFHTQADAIKNFCSIFKSKTSNAWPNVKSFTAKPNKYRLVDARWNKKPKKRTKIEIKLDYSLDADLPPTLHPLMKQIMDSRAGTYLGLSVNCPINQEMFAFGKMDDNILKEALEKLQQMGCLLKQINETKSNTTDLDVQKLKESYTQLSQLNSEYYRMIPRRKYAFDQIHLIDDSRDIEKEMSCIKNLLNRETASKILLVAMYNEKVLLNPMDYVYQALGVSMQLMDQENYMAQYILASTKEEGVKVSAIYEVRREGEEEKLRSELGNRMLLWHGTDDQNLLGILHRGLVYQPADSSSYHGELYGKGIYFADLLGKSLGYASSTTDTKLMILAEVALGKQLKLKRLNQLNESIHKNYDSLFVPGIRIPNPRGNLYLPSGVKMAVGNSKTVTRDDQGHRVLNSHNEYVVFRQEQICIRYVIAYK